MMGVPVLLLDGRSATTAVLSRADLVAALDAGVWPRHDPLQGNTTLARMRGMERLATAKQAVCLARRGASLADDGAALAVALKLYDLIVSGQVPPDNVLDALQDEFWAVGVIPMYFDGMPFRPVYVALTPNLFEPAILAQAQAAAKAQAQKRKQPPPLITVVDLDGPNRNRRD